MAARTNQYAEVTAESTTNSTTYVDKTTLTFTPEDSSTYYIIASWLYYGGSSSTSRRPFTKLTRTTGTAKDFAEVIIAVPVITEYQSAVGIGIDAFGASPGSQTYKIQHKHEASTELDAIKEAKIIAIKKDASDQSAEVNARSTTTSTTYQDKTTLTFTPATQGDYIIIATAVVDQSGTNYRTGTVLDIDGTGYGQGTWEPGAGADRASWGTVKRVNLTAASHTIKIQFRSSNTLGTSGIANARIIALRADTFDNNYYTDSTTGTTTTSSTYGNKITVTQTPQALAHVVFASLVYSEALGDGTNLAGVRLVEASTTMAESSHAVESANTRQSFFALYKKTLTAVSTAFKLDFKNSDNVNVVEANESAISVIQLDANAVAATTTPEIFMTTNTQFWGG